MQNNFRRYLIECLVSIVILCVLIFTCAFYVENKLLLFGILIIFGLCEKICIWFFAQRNIYSIIYKDLNPKLFLSVENSKYFYMHPMYRALGKMCIGAYQDTVDICTVKMKQNSKSNVVYLALLGRAYFELDDVVALREVCKNFKLHSEQNNKLLEKYPVFSFYQFYIDEQYDKCIEFCEHWIKKTENKSGKYNFAKINNFFNLAVSYYKNSDVSEASECFKKVIDIAPQMHISEISQTYLEKIEKGEITSLEFPTIIPNNSFKCEEGKIHEKKWKILRIVGWALIIVSAVIYIFLMIVNPSDSKYPNTEYGKQLNNIVDEHYDNFRVLGYSNAEFDGVVVDTIVLVYTEEKIDVVSYVSYADGKKTVIKRISDMQKDITYSFESTMGTHVIYVSLLDEETLTEQKTKISFEVGKKDMVFVVEQIVPLS